MPMRIVMSQTLDLPEEANLWDMSEASTIVVTQRGARRSFQKLLASKGVEVVEFDMLNPRDVMEYFHDRGHLSVLWECGGTLAASAIQSGVIHKVSLILFFQFFSLFPPFPFVLVNFFTVICPLHDEPPLFNHHTLYFSRLAGFCICCSQNHRW